MRKSLILTVLVGLLTCFSCIFHKSEITKPKAFNQPDTSVKVYESSDAQFVKDEPTDNTIVFGEDTPEDLIPDVGAIIQMPVSENTPYGFLGRVVSVQTDDGIVVTTEEVALDEAFPNLSIDTTIVILSDIMGVYDEDDNPVEYTIEDIEEEEKDAETRAIAEFDWASKQLNIPIPTDFMGDGFSSTGSIKVSFAGSKFDLDNKDGLKYLNLEIHPSIAISASITTTIKGGNKEISTKPLKIKARAVVGPVIIPITIPISCKAGIKGEFTSTLQLNFNKGCNVYVRYKDDKWTKGCEPLNRGDESPWVVSSFDVDGSLYAGVDVEVIFGIYTQNAGVGVELFPNANLAANASLTSVNPFQFNPEVSLGVELESRVFCMAKLFSMKLEVFDIKLPKAVFFRRSLSLFPNINEFVANSRGGTSAEVTYISSSYYFLEPLGVRTGAIVYRGSQEHNTYFTNPHRIDRQGNRYYLTSISDLQPGVTYYAAPVISWLNFKWVGEKQEFSTDGQYHLDFRCANWDYDVISFDFELNDKSGNVLDYTTEATDYDGSAMRVHILASYDADTMTMNGIFDFFFYDDPSQERRDGFTLNLSSDDSGYVICSRVVDNGGCEAAIRIYRVNSSSTRKRYDAPLTKSSCSVGLFNEHLKK